jgi:cell wall-associated NlpC family hydrolase
MTRAPSTAPAPTPAAVAFRAYGRWQLGLTVSLVCILTGAALGLLAAGMHHRPTALPKIKPVAVVAAAAAAGSDDSLTIPHDPMFWHTLWRPLVTTTQLQPIPSFVGVDDPPGQGPPPAIDPAVARLLAQLRHDAKGAPGGPHPGAEALTAVDFALSQVGRPYLWGAVGMDAYDCSGLTWRAYEQAGVLLPRVAADQYAHGGTPVAIADLLPGDLVFFATVAWDPGAVHHVGMYVGRGLMVDAPHPGASVRVEPVTAAGYVGAVRVVQERPTPSHRRPGPPPADPTSTPPTSGPTKPTPVPSSAPPDPGPASPSPSDPPTDPPTDPATIPPSDPPTDPATSPPSDPATSAE